VKPVRARRPAQRSPSFLHLRLFEAQQAPVDVLEATYKYGDLEFELREPVGVARDAECPLQRRTTSAPAMPPAIAPKIALSIPLLDPITPLSTVPRKTTRRLPLL
jgi:hypothetical protein